MGGNVQRMPIQTIKMRIKKISYLGNDEEFCHNNILGTQLDGSTSLNE